MKSLLTALLLLTANALATDSAKPTATPPATAKEDYNQAIASLMTREALADCIKVMDQLIEDGEHGTIDDQPDPGMVEVTTPQGLHFEFSATVAKKEATIYYFTISRGGRDLIYSDAVKFAALFAGRAALPNPINLTEGDKMTFYAQWLIKPSDWKSMKKKMLKYRAVNRAETDPIKAFVAAIDRELEARAAAQQIR